MCVIPMTIRSDVVALVAKGLHVRRQLTSKPPEGLLPMVGMPIENYALWFDESTSQCTMSLPILLLG
ncbi:hypothetical protein ACVI1L_004642 [Bradyrhizobium sp. USDA 4516]|nr:hypothetical protein [Bradyrhizobium sp. USDA 4541]